MEYLVEYEACVDKAASYEMAPRYEATKCSFTVDGTIDLVYESIANIMTAAHYGVNVGETKDATIRNILDLKISRPSDFKNPMETERFRYGYFIPRNWKIYMKKAVDFDEGFLERKSETYKNILDMLK